MIQLILPNFWSEHEELKNYIDNAEEFNNNDELLKKEAEKVIEKRKALGLQGLVGDLEILLINTELDNQEGAVEEYLKFTGYDFNEGYENDYEKVYVLSQNNSPDILIKSRKQGDNPYVREEYHPKSQGMINTRIEAFIYSCSDIKKYYEIQKGLGVRFLTDHIVEEENYYMLLTIPSSFTNTSYGVIQWKDNKSTYVSKDYKKLEISLNKPKEEYINNIKEMDHIATRIQSKDRDAAILEFMKLTNYDFNFAIYIEKMNSITNVSRLPKGKVAMVFTAGIEPFKSLEEAGPTEKFVYNYGARPHHIAYNLENIEYSFEKLKEKGMEFLIDLVGNEEEGIVQTFSRPSKNTLIVNEYIYRYGDFDGFFTKDNVADLTASTDKQ
ncbi:hypothetical protein [Clostridium sp.]|uniref:hypothetical protein n=1 Tax=Clostridium sp. TaxID=1506 RepID=UPI003464093A